MTTMKAPATLPYFNDWPRIKSDIRPDPQIEKKLEEILSQMTLEEKIGQMIQPNLRDVTPDEVYKYKLGSILNGGGTWPDENKRSGPEQWASKADEFWLATEKAFRDRPFRIPFMWATDAVHGHNNAFGATVFPHNIGLGAARDPELIERIGEATALEVCATGLDWTFAPTVATPRDLRWGRVYEGYSEDPEITFAYAEAMVRGLQGDASSLRSDEKVISNVKHWVGDGGTAKGVDRGENHYSEDELRNIHAMGYFSGLNAGAQVVMSSFNTWENNRNYDHAPSEGEKYNYKIHGSRYLITDVLKDKMGFDGLVVTDWHGHSEVSKCSDTNATYAVNAGNDILMVPVREHWTLVYEQTLSDAREGVIPADRIDDAVRRILRVKMRAGLWDKPQPGKRKHAGNPAALCNEQHKALAREAVRKSLVLLKNSQGILPLPSDKKILLTGSAANDIQKQTGGWNLTWQGDENSLDDFPNASTVKCALEKRLGGDKVVFDPNLNSEHDDIDTAIVVFGEDPYAEMMGDIKEWQTLEYASLKRAYRKDVRLIHRLHQEGKKVISLFFSGRPLYMNAEISKSTAFIAAFLPGTEAEGISDLIIGDVDGNPVHDFTGKLSYSWPGKKRSYCVNRIPQNIPGGNTPACELSPDGEHAPLFPYGYGLSCSDPSPQALDHLPEDTDADNRAASALELFGVRSIVGDYRVRVINPSTGEELDVSRNNPLRNSWITTTPYNYQLQQDAVRVKTHSEPVLLSLETGDAEDERISGYVSLCFDLLVSEAPSKPVWLSVGEGEDESFRSGADISRKMCSDSGQWQTLEFPLSELTVARSVPCSRLLTLRFEGETELVIANIRLVA